MKNKAFSLLTLALSGAALVVALISFNQKDGLTLAPKEPPFERIMRTGVIRCGYVLWPPSSWKDPQHGKFPHYYDLSKSSASGWA